VAAPASFLACGALGTAAIVVRSGWRDRVVVRDTATIFAAAVRLGRTKVQRRSHHGLSQWWVRRTDSVVSAQIYPPDAGNAQRLAQRAPLLERLAPRLLRAIAGRLHPVIAYVDPEQSDRLQVGLVEGEVFVDRLPRAGAQRVVKGALRSLASVMRRGGYFLPAFAAEVSGPGTGYHSGASLPFGTETDSLGRLDGLKRTHIVDASVLPLIEVGSVTPTVMANAARIGRAWAEQGSAGGSV